MSNLNNDIDRCTIVTTNDKRYNAISKVPKSEYSLVYMMVDFNIRIIKIDDKYFNLINNFTNLRFILCDYDNWTKYSDDKIINDISIFTKLSIFSVIDYVNFSLIYYDMGNYICKNKMTIFFSNETNLSNIPKNILYLNIISESETDYINIPNTVKYLHICINNINQYKQTNLPFCLKSITITIPEIYKRICKKKLNSIIETNTKLPFNCKLIIDNVF